MRRFDSWRPLLLLALAALTLGCGSGGAAAPRTQDQLDFGVAMARRGLWNEALFRFRQAAEERPGDFRILNNMAVAYEAVGLFDEALETYKRALEISPGDRELKRNYSRFVEFYQAFRPQEPAAGGDSPTAGDPSSPPPASDGP